MKRRKQSRRWRGKKYAPVMIGMLVLLMNLADLKISNLISGSIICQAVQDVLPVEILPYDDRMEHCEGVHAEVTLPDHPAFAGIEGEWPPVLGYNKSTIKPEAELAATVCGDPFIAFGSYGEGKSAVFSSDCSPHWVPPEFCNWKYYDVLFKNILDYIAK